MQGKHRRALEIAGEDDVLLKVANRVRLRLDPMTTAQSRKVGFQLE